VLTTLPALPENLKGFVSFTSLFCKESAAEDGDVVTMEVFATLVSSLRDVDFQQHFRIQQETFSLLHNLTGPHVSNKHQDHSGRATINVDKQRLYRTRCRFCKYVLKIMVFH